MLLLQKKMKQLKIALFLLFLSSTTSLEANALFDEPDSTVIIGGTPIGNGTGGNRAPSRQPVTICYCAPISSVVLSFSVTLGTVDVLIVNSTTGEFLEGEIISSPGSFPIPISGTPGYYYAVATLPNGKQHKTEFQL